MMRPNDAVRRGRRWASYTLRGLGTFAVATLLLSACGFEWIFGLPDDAEPNVPATATAARQASPTPMRTPTPTATPRETRAPTATPKPTPRPVPTATLTPSPIPTPVRVTGLAELLPSADDLPSELELDREDADLSPDEVASEAEDAADYLERLDAWGFRGGAFREFVLPDPGLGDFFSKMLGFQATVLEFDSAAHAREALTFQHSYALTQPDWELERATLTAPLGDTALALNGTAKIEGTTVRAAVVFVQKGPRLYRFVGISGADDKFDTTVDIARATIS